MIRSRVFLASFCSCFKILLWLQSLSLFSKKKCVLDTGIKSLKNIEFLERSRGFKTLLKNFSDSRGRSEIFYSFPERNKTLKILLLVRSRPTFIRFSSLNNYRCVKTCECFMTQLGELEKKKKKCIWVIIRQSSAAGTKDVFYKRLKESR